MTLIHLFPVVGEEKCHRWDRNFIEVINTERPDSYSFSKGAWPFYQLESSISYLNSTTGEWQFFNLSGNIIVLQNSSDGLSLQIKVTVCYFSNFIEVIGVEDTLPISQLNCYYSYAYNSDGKGRGLVGLGRLTLILGKKGSNHRRKKRQQDKQLKGLGPPLYHILSICNEKSQRYLVSQHLPDSHIIFFTGRLLKYPQI